MNVIDNKINDTSTGKFRLVCKSQDFSDAEVEKYFLNIEVSSEKELLEVIDVLQELRSSLFNKLENSIK